RRARSAPGPMTADVFKQLKPERSTRRPDDELAQLSQQPQEDRRSCRRAPVVPGIRVEAEQLARGNQIDGLPRLERLVGAPEYLPGRRLDRRGAGDRLGRRSLDLLREREPGQARP